MMFLKEALNIDFIFLYLYLLKIYLCMFMFSSVCGEKGEEKDGSCSCKPGAYGDR